MTNSRSGKIGAAIIGLSVSAFALSMLVSLTSGVSTVFISELVCIFLALGYILFASAVYKSSEKKEESAVGLAGLLFAAVYTTIIVIVYFAGVTTVNLNHRLSAETLSIIDYSHTGSLFFNYDLLGYAVMALSTFLLSFAVKPKNKGDYVFQVLLRIHGVFFLPCLFLPMFPIFSSSNMPIVFSVLILESWCIYFLPICALGWRYFNKDNL